LRSHARGYLYHHASSFGQVVERFDIRDICKLAIAQGREEDEDDETFSHLWVIGIPEAVDRDGDQHGHGRKNTKVPYIRMQRRAMAF
jgi:hypothetical protein